MVVLLQLGGWRSAVDSWLAALAARHASQKPPPVPVPAAASGEKVDRLKIRVIKPARRMSDGTPIH
jgi:hypothetical protein